MNKEEQKIQEWANKWTLESLRQRYTNVSKWIVAYKHAHDRVTSDQSKKDIEKTI